jgi:hypothetical protein
MDTSDESSSLDSLELGDQVRYILKPPPKIHQKYSNSSSNNNNNSSTNNNNNNINGLLNKNAKAKSLNEKQDYNSSSSSSSIGNKCHIRITNDATEAGREAKTSSSSSKPQNSSSRTTALSPAESKSNSCSGQKQQQPGVGPSPAMILDPRCQEVVSGHITMVTVEGGAVAGQLDRLQAEITRLKVEKLELLRQNVAAQREVKHLRERELQLQADLSTASREINKLRTGLKQRLVKELPWPDLPPSLRGPASSPATAHTPTVTSPSFSSASADLVLAVVSGTPRTPTAAVKVSAEERLDKTWHI